MQLVVLSTYDLIPVRDGGQTRYLNLYSRLSQRHDVTLIAYDHRQTGRTRTYYINSRFQVILPPMLPGDATLFRDNLQRSNRLTHDVNCIRQYKFSTEFHRVLQAAVNSCDVLVASHPYLALAAFSHAAASTAKLYEAHNVEYDARRSYYRGTTDPALTRLLLEDVRFGEGFAAHDADYVTAVSSTDADRLVELYDIPRSKLTIVPNGVDIASYPLLDPHEKQMVRDRLGLGGRPLAVFVGSAYLPNAEAYLRIREMLLQAGYSGAVAIIGTVNEAVPGDLTLVPFKERWLGFVEEELKTLLLTAADFALHLMFSGAGTNLKLFDYMAARALIVGNSFGTRGVAGGDWFWPVETSDDLRQFLEKRPWETMEGEGIAARARAVAEQQFDWGVSARILARLLTQGRGALNIPLCWNKAEYS